MITKRGLNINPKKSIHQKLVNLTAFLPFFNNAIDKTKKKVIYVSPLNLLTLH